MCDSYYEPTCLCPAAPQVSQGVKKTLCEMSKPLAQNYCKTSEDPKQCENIARIACLDSTNAKQLFNYLERVGSGNEKPASPCSCNEWRQCG